MQVTSRGYTEAITELANLGLPWLALGGGGYDLSAVARCWTLAYGVMLGEEWPDLIPTDYAQQHGMQSLRDTVALDVPAHVRAEAKILAEESVAAIKSEIFPKHQLGG